MGSRLVSQLVLLFVFVVGVVALCGSGVCVGVAMWAGFGSWLVAFDVAFCV